MKRILLIGLVCFFSPVFADIFSPTANYRVCFTPQEDCTAEIVNAIDNAQHSVWVQAYSFTSHPIGRALVEAKERGVDVRVILDSKNTTKDVYSEKTMQYFNRNGVPLWLDYKPNIAHNKVMIIDDKLVVTGSFNFTRAAQMGNAENVMLIQDMGLAHKYQQNWVVRARESKEINKRQSSTREYTYPTSRHSQPLSFKVGHFTFVFHP